MKFFVISDNTDTQTGMRLTGADGVVAHERQEVEEALARAFSDPEIGIVLMTQNLINLCPELVFDYKLNRKRPLIVEIPDRHGSSEVSEAIARYVKEAVGITI